MKEKRKNRLEFFSEHAKNPGVLCLGLQLAPCTKRKRKKNQKAAPPGVRCPFPAYSALTFTPINFHNPLSSSGKAGGPFKLAQTTHRAHLGERNSTLRRP